MASIISMEEFKKLRNRASAHKSHYVTYWQPKHRELSDVIMPERGRFDDRDTQPNDGKKRFKIVDHTAGISAERLAAAMLDGLSPPTRDWMKVEFKDKDLMEEGEVKAWLDAVNMTIKQTLHDTNAYNSLGDLYEEVAVFGTGAMFIDSDPLDVVNFQTFTTGTYYVASNSKGLVNKWYRYYRDTADNVVEKFGKENVSIRVNRLIERNEGYTYVDLVHTIEANLLRDITKEDNLNMPFISVYYELDSQDNEKPLRQSGYEDFPLIVPRYRTVGDETYGQSPCNRALGITKSLQEMTKDLLRASKKTIDPMLNVPNKLKNVKRGAGGVNHYAGEQGAPKIEAVYQVKYDFQGNLLVSDQMRDQINKILNSDLFSAISNLDKTGRTATEITQRVAEAIKMLVAFVTRMNTEALKPLIERVYKLLLAAGRLPQVPDQVADLDLEIVFVSSLAQAQQAVGLAALEQITDYVTRVSQVAPGALLKFNEKQAVDEYARMNGVRSTIIRTDEEVQQIEQADAEAAEQEKTAALMAQMAEGAEKLGNTPMNTGSALDTVVGGLQNAG
jgi:hypothetical protein